MHRALAAALVAALAGWSSAARVIPAWGQEPAKPAPLSPGPQGAEVDELRRRAAAFWAARTAGDAKAEWELLEPRGRGRLEPKDYSVGQGAVRYLAYQVEDVTVNGHFATVAVRVLMQAMLPTSRGQVRKMSPETSVLADRWVRVGGVWYRSLEQDNR
jgi:hypothetical protein